MDVVNFNLRIDEDLNEKLIKIAEKEGRSKNKQIEYILRNYVNNYEDKDSRINISQNNNKKATVKIKEQKWQKQQKQPA